MTPDNAPFGEIFADRLWLVDIRICLPEVLTMQLVNSNTAKLGESIDVSASGRILSFKVRDLAWPSFIRLSRNKPGKADANTPPIIHMSRLGPPPASSSPPPPPPPPPPTKTNHLPPPTPPFTTFPYSPL